MLLNLTLFLGNSCTVKYAPPKSEMCIHNQDNSAQCNDPRKENGSRDYTRSDLTNYLCTNSADYNNLFNYSNGLREKLIKCENK